MLRPTADAPAFVAHTRLSLTQSSLSKSKSSYGEASGYTLPVDASETRFGVHLRHSIIGNHHLAHLENVLEDDIKHMEAALPQHKKLYAICAPSAPTRSERSTRYPSSPATAFFVRDRLLLFCVTTDTPRRTDTGTVLLVIAIITVCQLIAIFAYDESGQTQIGTIVLRTGPPCQPGQYENCRVRGLAAAAVARLPRNLQHHQQSSAIESATRGTALVCIHVCMHLHHVLTWASASAPPNSRVTTPSPRSSRPPFLRWQLASTRLLRSGGTTA